MLGESELIGIIFSGGVRIFSEEYHAYKWGFQYPGIILDPVNNVFNHSLVSPFFRIFAASNCSECNIIIQKPTVIN